jgi:Lrp/AsnC family transcriptional regulator for asnA, asnC and gidA
MKRSQKRNTAAFDETDAKIVSQLRFDGRKPNTAIARRLGLAEGTVRKRIDRLLRDGVMQVGAWADPLKVGYQIYAVIEIQVNPPDIERVAERLARLPEIYFLGMCTGAFDLFAAAVLRSNDHLSEFLARRLNRVPGIQRTSTSNIIRLIKRENPGVAVSRDRRRPGE